MLYSLISFLRVTGCWVANTSSSTALTMALAYLMNKQHMQRVCFETIFLFVSR
jgi:hypothetical protein